MALLLAVSQGADWGWTSSATLVLAGAGVVGVASWVGWTLRREHPLVDLRLAWLPGVRGPHVTALALGVGMYSLLSLGVVLVRTEPADGFGLGLGVAAAGLVLVPYSLAAVGGSALARRVERRWGGHLLLPLGCTSFAASLALLAWQHGHLWQLLLAMAVGGLGSGFTFGSIPGLLVPHVPTSETGSAMAFNQLLRYLGFATGSALSVTLFHVLGGDGRGFTRALLVFAAVCLGTGLVNLRRAARR